MSISDLNMTFAQGDYISDRDLFIKRHENDTLRRTGQNGGIINVNGNPTIGYGFDLVTFSNSAAIIVSYLTDALGGAGNLTATQQAGLDLISNWKTGTAVDLGDGNGRRVLTNADIIAIADPTRNLGTPAQRQALQSLSLTDAQATRLLHDVLDGFVDDRGVEHQGLEAMLSQTLGASDVAQSQERIALVDLRYNARSLVGNGLQGALASADPAVARALAWVEIRYIHVPVEELGSELN